MSNACLISGRSCEPEGCRTRPFYNCHRTGRRGRHARCRCEAAVAPRRRGLASAGGVPNVVTSMRLVSTRAKPLFSTRWPFASPRRAAAGDKSPCHSGGEELRVPGASLAALCCLTLPCPAGRTRALPDEPFDGTRCLAEGPGTRPAANDRARPAATGRARRRRAQGYAAE